MHKHKHLIAVSVFILTAIVFTWPLVLNMTNSYPSTFVMEGGDPNMYIWFMDLMAKKVMDPGLNVGEMVYYPRGMNFLAGYEAPIILLVSTPVILLTHNPILAYNFILLAAFVLTAYACYVFILYLTKSYYSSVITGFSFGFSQYMIVRSTQHIDLLFLFCIPLVTLYAFKFVEKPSRRNIFMLSLSVLVAALSAWYYLVGVLILLGIFFLFNFNRFKSAVNQYLLAISGILVSLLLTAAPMFLNRTEVSAKYVDRLIDTRGAAPWNFFIPHHYTSMWKFTSEIYLNYISPYEATSYYGIVGLVALVGIIFLWRKINIPYKAFWITVTIVFMLISFGTYLALGRYSIPMPFSVMDEFMPFSRLRAPNRFFVFSYFGATVIFGYLLAYTKNLVIRPSLKISLAVLIVLLLLSERWIFPYPLMSIPVPEFYKTLGENKEEFAIADIPISNPGFSLYNYYQTIHGKPIVTGEYFWTAYNDSTFNYLKNNDLLVNSLACYVAPDNIDKQKALQQLANDNIRYVVVHNFILHSQDCVPLTVFIHEFFKGQKIVFSDGEITVYETGH